MARSMIVFVAATAALVGVAAVDLVIKPGLLYAWLITMLLLLVFVLVLGVAQTGRPAGVLIDERNKYSLSRLQTLMWTVIALSAFAALGLTRLANGTVDPFGIALPQELWIALGVTATALVGSPLVRATKMTDNRQPNQDEFARTKLALGGGDKVNHRGLIVFNTSADDASWLDLFRGEETGNAAILDLGKIQMFYFTAIVLGAYAALIWGQFTTTGTTPAVLPDFTPTLVGLLGLANGTYLANKVVPHSATQ